MKRLCAASVVLGMILATPASLGEAVPRIDAGAIAFVSDLDKHSGCAHG